MTDLKVYQAQSEKEYYIDIGAREACAVFMRFEAGEGIFGVLDDEKEVMEVALDLQQTIRTDELKNSH